MSNLTKWTEIPTNQYEEPQEVGFELDAGSFISPYDIPDGIRATYNPRDPRVVFEFRYLVDEPFRYSRDDTWKEQDREKERAVSVGFGKYSDRIIRLELEADLPDLVDHRPQWMHAIVAAIKRMKQPDMANYYVASRVLEDLYDNLLSQVDTE
ncbi:MAG: hypothetical protein OXI33_17490 [Chloroflexota bacterium]|nr:hypothetical protein [Chloroflexota bacterium]